MLWWSAHILCPTCQESSIIKNIDYSADGGIRITGYCPKCDQGCRWNTTSEQMKEMARMADDKATLGKQEENPVKKTNRPIPFLTERLSCEDMELMKKWNIKP